MECMLFSKIFHICPLTLLSMLFTWKTRGTFVCHSNRGLDWGLVCGLIDVRYPCNSPSDFYAPETVRKHSEKSQVITSVARIVLAVLSVMCSGFITEPTTAQPLLAVWTHPPKWNMKLDATDLRYIGSEEFRVLTAVEMGSKNHEVVPTALIAQISGLRSGGVNKHLGSLAKRNLVARVQNTKCYLKLSSITILLSLNWLS